MAEIHATKDLFLWCLSVIYLFAFASLFVQIPGLYGDNGILPVKLVLQPEAESFYDLLTNQPTLLRLLPKVGLDLETSMDFLSLGGVIVSFVAMVSHDFRNCIVFGVLWAFYLSLVQVGQTFLWFQWDILLVEVGFLAILVAPLNFFGFFERSHHHFHDKIAFWLIRWLLFRLTFMSGIIKLLSKNYTWWNLTQMKYHYETMVLPTPMAWYFHQLPDWIHQLSAIVILTIEIPLSLFFFSPVKKQRSLAFYSQCGLMVFMMLTGNFNFYPLLVLTLSLSIVDDEWVNTWIGHSQTEKERTSSDGPLHSGFTKKSEFVFSVLIYSGLFFAIVRSFFFNLKLSPLNLEPEIAFSPEDLDYFLLYLFPFTIILGAASLGWQVFEAVYKALSDRKNKLRNLSCCIFFSLVAFSVFAVSLVPYTSPKKEIQSYLPEQLQDIHSWTLKNYHLPSPYGFFHVPNDERGRFEIVIEGSNKLLGKWKEYNFRFKPGKVSGKLSIVAPHQPRLDWQMWFAARSPYDQNQWFLNFIYRLLSNKQEVLELMDTNPFPENPPKYVRATLYKYHFASKNTTKRYAASDWWTREAVEEYLPALNKNEPTFVGYLKESGIYEEIWDPERDAEEETERNFLCSVLDTIRSLLGQGNGNIVCLFLFISGFILTLVDQSIKFPLHDGQLVNGITASYGLSNK